MTQHHNITTARSLRFSRIASYRIEASHSHLWRCPANSLITRRARTRSSSTSAAAAAADEAMAGHEQWCNIIISISSSSSTSFFLASFNFIFFYSWNNFGRRTARERKKELK